jgi:hypothetical protein
MPPRIPSPFNAAKRAVVEPIVQPLYDKVQITAAGQSKATFFSQGIGTAGVDQLITNLDTPNILAAPKIFVILGLRLHYTQLAADAVSDVAFAMTDVLKIAYSYWYQLIVGAKSYKTVPAFYLSSGLGFNGQHIAAAAAEIAHGNMGWPHFQSYDKVDRHPITIPPQQNFRAELNRSAAFPSDLSEARNVWNFLEGDYGREVQ